ncbi:Glucan endo-1,3-beta-glucosidase 11 [Acorus gramineus]|uniref:Glucan endo-1,3-beta-glucosidase 11 n=1 Tax=Acorus gramineus TaxID=55184 RepID=A0AAV9AZD0_ACOGR|nr:Glucan endo-1,3-beta-glucosidase 11 [Acorus gramineus]
MRVPTCRQLPGLRETTLCEKHINLDSLERYGATITSLDINYGQVADNLLSPTQLVALLSSLNLTKIRIYNTNPQVLSTFANSNIEVIVTVPNGSPLIEEP